MFPANLEGFFEAEISIYSSSLGRTVAYHFIDLRCADNEGAIGSERDLLYVERSAEQLWLRYRAGSVVAFAQDGTRGSAGAGAEDTPGNAGSGRDLPAILYSPSIVPSCWSRSAVSSLTLLTFQPCVVSTAFVWRIGCLITKGSKQPSAQRSLLTELTLPDLSGLIR